MYQIQTPRVLNAVLSLFLFLGVESAVAQAPINCYGTIDSATTLTMLVDKCGKANSETGSGVYILLWVLADGSVFSASSAGYALPILSARLTKTDGSVQVLFENKKR